jgi:hypothetical protein
MKLKGSLIVWMDDQDDRWIGISLGGGAFEEGFVRVLFRTTRQNRI